MRTTLDCIPCFIRQALEAARFTTADTTVHESIVREVLAEAARMDLMDSPPLVGQRIHRRLREITGVEDPYRAVKERFGLLALGMLPELRTQIAEATDPLAMAVRLAIAGNVIDLGVNGGLTEAHVHEALEQVLWEPLHGDMEGFREAVARAGSILYLADNAGEIVFDRVLIEQLPAARVTVAVRGRAVINDATRVDAEAAGMADVAEVIDNGSDAPGTVLSDCGEAFRERFRRADLIIAKGQGNFETLSEAPGDIFFLLKAKCPVIASHVNLNVGAHVLMRSVDVPERR